MEKIYNQDAGGLEPSAQLFSILGRVRKNRHVFGLHSSTSSIEPCVISCDQTQTSSHLLMSASGRPRS